MLAVKIEGPPLHLGEGFVAQSLLLPDHRVLNQAQEVILQLPRQGNQKPLNQKMTRMTRVPQQIQFSSVVSIADRIVSLLLILDHHLLKMRLQRSLQQDLEQEMVMSEEGEVIHLPHEGVIGIPLQEKGVLHHPVDVGVALLLHPDAADLLLPDEGHHPRPPEDDLLPRGVTLLLFSGAIAPHRCHRKKENCLVLPLDGLLQGPNADLPGHLNEGALQLKGAALLLLLHPHQDTGEVQCTRRIDQKGTAVRLHLQQTAVAIQEDLPVHMGVLKLLHPTIESRGLQIPNPFEECLERQNLVMSRDLLQAHSLLGEYLQDLGLSLLNHPKNGLPPCLRLHHHHALLVRLLHLPRRPAVVLPVSPQIRIQM